MCVSAKTKLSTARGSENKKQRGKLKSGVEHMTCSPFLGLYLKVLRPLQVFFQFALPSVYI